MLSIYTIVCVIAEMMPIIFLATEAHQLYEKENKCRKYATYEMWIYDAIQLIRY